LLHESKSDSELMALGALWNKAVAQVAALAHQHSCQNEDEIIGLPFDIADEIEAAPAMTAAGAAIKLRVALYGAKIAAEDPGDMEYTWRLVSQALDTLETFGATGEEDNDRRDAVAAIQSHAEEVTRQNRTEFTWDSARAAFAARKYLWDQNRKAALRKGEKSPSIPTEQQDSVWLRLQFTNVHRSHWRALRQEFWPSERSKRGPRGPRRK
jgi:hypothetical protein